MSKKYDKIFYVPPARKLVFSLQLTVAQCTTFRQKGMKCKILLAKPYTFELRMRLLKSITITQDRENQNGRDYS